MSHSPRAASRRSRRLRAVLAVTAAVLLAACGSQVPPQQFFDVEHAAVDAQGAQQPGGSGDASGGSTLAPQGGATTGSSG